MRGEVGVQQHARSPKRDHIGHSERHVLLGSLDGARDAGDGGDAADGGTCAGGLGRGLLLLQRLSEAVDTQR